MKLTPLGGQSRDYLKRANPDKTSSSGQLGRRGAHVSRKTMTCATLVGFTFPYVVRFYTLDEAGGGRVTSLFSVTNGLLKARFSVTGSGVVRCAFH